MLVLLVVKVKLEKTMFEDYKKLKRNEKFSKSKKENLKLQAHLDRPSWLILQESVAYHKEIEAEEKAKPREFLPSLEELLKEEARV